MYYFRLCFPIGLVSRMYARSCRLSPRPGQHLWYKISQIESANNVTHDDVGCRRTCRRTKRWMESKSFLRQLPNVGDWDRPDFISAAVCTPTTSWKVIACRKQRRAVPPPPLGWAFLAVQDRPVFTFVAVHFPEDITMPWSSVRVIDNPHVLENMP
ncbi:unnamed protein product, partial [Scytosiphon promiscuus]